MAEISHHVINCEVSHENIVTVIYLHIKAYPHVDTTIDWEVISSHWVGIVVFPSGSEIPPME